jgi:hypothetical protein
VGFLKSWQLFLWYVSFFRSFLMLVIDFYQGPTFYGVAAYAAKLPSTPEANIGARIRRRVVQGQRESASARAIAPTSATQKGPVPCSYCSFIILAYALS